MGKFPLSEISASCLPRKSAAKKPSKTKPAAEALKLLIAAESDSRIISVEIMRRGDVIRLAGSAIF